MICKACGQMRKSPNPYTGKELYIDYCDECKIVEVILPYEPNRRSHENIDYSRLRWVNGDGTTRY